jgi:hypothetical protein
MKTNREKFLGILSRAKRMPESGSRSWMRKFRLRPEIVGKGRPGSMAWGVRIG